MKKIVGLLLLNSGLLFILNISGCDVSGNSIPLKTPFEIGFEYATSPGDTAVIATGFQNVDMIHINNGTAITFPFSPVYGLCTDNNTAVVSRKIFMSKTEVTNSLFAEVYQWACNSGKFSTTPSDHNGLDATTVKYGGRELMMLSSSDARVRYSNGKFSVDTGFENHPVNFVSWYGAVMFCNWLTEMRDGNTGNLVYTAIPVDGTWNDDNAYNSIDETRSGYRLPSSEEWEYAARYIGETAPSIGNLAFEYISQNYNTGSSGLTSGYFWTPGAYASGATADYTDATATAAVAVYGPLHPAEVMSKGVAGANKLGLQDMSGNLGEWCSTASELKRVVRGGRVGSTAVVASIGYWSRLDSTGEYDSIGFRFVKTQ